jgi:putative sugar O-methyltransferase
MQRSDLSAPMAAYRRAPAIFQATAYWQSYEGSILEVVRDLDESQLRSGRYPVLSTFGFGDLVFTYHPNQARWKRGLLKLAHRVVAASGGRLLPYGVSLSDLREMAFRQCELVSQLVGAPSIRSIESSRFGSPHDVFEVDGRPYTMGFLTYYLRYCFAQRHVRLRGDETIVELGTGSGVQVEVLKKLYPDLTVLCFDLPVQLHLCEGYLSEALGTGALVGADRTRDWADLSGLERGKVHFFGNWQFPLLRGFQHDLFWNAASFGEMEPEVVENYLSLVHGGARDVYLCQARHGKETRGRQSVQRPTRFEDYGRLLSGYRLRGEEREFRACRPGSESGGYFQAVWSREPVPEP